MGSVVHVLPVNDSKPHDESEACECCPRIRPTLGGYVVVHNSYDRRELFETTASEMAH